MKIYSGKCLYCECGERTPFVDMSEERLYTGDIVIMFVEDEHGMTHPPDGLSAIVSNKYTTYTDGKIELNETGSQPFVMGIANCVMEKTDGAETVFRSGENRVWRVMRVKSWRDVVSGENWTEWGFNYK